MPGQYIVADERDGEGNHENGVKPLKAAPEERSDRCFSGQQQAIYQEPTNHEKEIDTDVPSIRQEKGYSGHYAAVLRVLSKQRVEVNKEYDQRRKTT
jgi:hypothetical protein